MTQAKFIPSEARDLASQVFTSVVAVGKSLGGINQ